MNVFLLVLNAVLACFQAQAVSHANVQDLSSSTILVSTTDSASANLAFQASSAPAVLQGTMQMDRISFVQLFPEYIQLNANRRFIYDSMIREKLIVLSNFIYLLCNISGITD